MMDTCLEFARYIRNNDSVLSGINNTQIAFFIWQECYSKSESWSIRNAPKYLAAFEVAKSQLDREEKEKHDKAKQEVENRIEAISKGVRIVLSECVVWVDQCGKKFGFFDDYVWTKKLLSTVIIGSSDPKKLAEAYAQCPMKDQKIPLKAYGNRTIRFLAEEILAGSLQNTQLALAQRLLARDGTSIILDCPKQFDKEGFKCHLTDTPTSCWRQTLTLQLK